MCLRRHNYTDKRTVGTNHFDCKRIIDVFVVCIKYHSQKWDTAIQQRVCGMRHANERKKKKLDAAKMMPSLMFCLFDWSDIKMTRSCCHNSNSFHCLSEWLLNKVQLQPHRNGKIRAIAIVVCFNCSTAASRVINFLVWCSALPRSDCLRIKRECDAFFVWR